MSWFSVIVVAAVLGMNVSNVALMNLQCSVENVYWDEEYAYACSAKNLEILSPDIVISTLNGKGKPSSSNALAISHQKVYFIPKGLNKFFLDLKRLKIEYSKLQSIKQEDLKPFKTLTHLALSDNDLTYVESDLFKFNIGLKRINFDYNKLRIIGTNILTPLKNIHYATFRSNICINNFGYAPLFAQVKEDIRSKCSLPQEITSKIENLEILLKILETRHKSCDGNLDAAADNLLIASKELKSCISHENFVQTPAEEHKINLEGKFNGSHFNASDFFIVKFNNSTIEQVFEKNMTKEGEAFDLDAVSALMIHEQQVLFLPSNIANIFKNLTILSVTSSGLIQIDSDAFKDLTNLTDLILWGNKLIEIPADTFNELNNLVTIDLSMNKLKSLENNIFNNLLNLSKLNLNNNFIETINYEVLQSLKNLKELSLQNNKLKYISANLFAPLTKLTYVNINDNICINVSFPNSTLKEIEAMIIDSCIEPIELVCKSTIKVMKLELTVVQTVLICEAELAVYYPKTKIANLTSFHVTKEGIDNNVILFSAINQTMKFLPYQLGKTFPKLITVFIERSQLTTLQKHDFEGLTKLKKIIVHHNNLTVIDEQAFDDVKQIEELNLSYNSIKSLPRKIFFHLVHLKTLILSNNQIKTFTADFLPRKNSITDFSFDSNQLEVIETKILRFLRNSEKIDLSANICIDKKFERSEGNLQAMLMLSGEIDLSCSADDLSDE